MLESTPELLTFLRQSHLFNGLSDRQLEQLLPLMREVCVKEGTCIIQENEVSDELYVVKEGELKVTKLEPTTGKALQLATLERGSIVGELTLLDDAPRSASVYASKNTILLVLSITELKALSAGDMGFLHVAEQLSELAQAAKTVVAKPPLYTLLLQNLARNLSFRMRTANDALLEDLRKELAHTQARVVMGTVIVMVIVVMSLYTLALEVLSQAHLFSPTLLSTPLIAVFSVLVIIAIKKTRYPLSFFGLTWENWRRYAWEAIIFTLPVLIIIVLYKWLLIHTSPAFANHHVFELSIGFSNPNQLKHLLMLVGYVAFVPLQELMVRGALQGPLQKLLISPRKDLWAILLSNLIFSTTHFHLSLGIGLIVYVPGLFWGWLYARQKTLVGVTVSHQLIGVWALFIVGFL
jgi:CRP-like cAMP-binding protein